MKTPITDKTESEIGALAAKYKQGLITGTEFMHQATAAFDRMRILERGYLMQRPPEWYMDAMREGIATKLWLETTRWERVIIRVKYFLRD